MTNSFKIPSPDGKGMVDAVDVPIEESTERWSDYKLTDGTHLRIKQNVLKCVKVIGQKAPDGNPLYALQAAPVMVVVSTKDKD